MTDMQDYESRLRTLIEKEEASTRSSLESLRNIDAHPMSSEYKMHNWLALMAAGRLTGLLVALTELTGDDSKAKEVDAQIRTWISG